MDKCGAVPSFAGWERQLTEGLLLGKSDSRAIAQVIRGLTPELAAGVLRALDGRVGAKTLCVQPEARLPFQRLARQLGVELQFLAPQVPASS